MRSEEEGKEIESLMNPYPSNKSDEQLWIEQQVRIATRQSALIGSVLRAD